LLDLSLRLCREPNEEILRNITLGLYRVRLVRIARSKLTGRFVSVRSEAYVQNPNEYIVFESGQVYNRINGRIVANNVCIYVQIIHAKHIAYDAERQPQHRSIHGEVNIRGYVRLDKVDYTNPERPILDKSVENNLNEIMLQKMYEQPNFEWLDGIVTWDIIGTEVTNRYYIRYSPNWELEAWYSHGEIYPSFSSAQYKVHEIVVINENELY